MTAVVKRTESHDRITITAKYPNGEKLRVNCSRYRTSCSTNRPAGSAPLPKDALNNILKATEPKAGETYGTATIRLAKAIENSNSIEHACSTVL